MFLIKIIIFKSNYRYYSRRKLHMYWKEFIAQRIESVSVENDYFY